MVCVIGLDIAKKVFQLYGVDEVGEVVLKRKLRRPEVMGLFAKLEPALVGIEACHTGHYWAREIARLGHDVRLMRKPSAKLWRDRLCGSSRSRVPTSRRYYS